MACSGVPVSTDYSRDFDFSNVSSYAWLLPAKHMNPEVDNDLVRERIVDAVEGRATIIVDGSIMRGTDVVKAMALGAGAR